MRIFDYSFLDKGLLPSNLVNFIGNIAVLSTKVIAHKSECGQVFTELESIAKVQSVKSSNAIEGIITSDDRIVAIVNQNSAPLNHDEAEIAGYRDALNQVHLNHPHLSFNVDTILNLHDIMLSYAGTDFAGKFKTEDNVILEVDSQGKRKVRFRTTPADETTEAMEQLELAYIEARDNPRINKLLLIPCVILDFLCIHPFRDGNGRMSRLLTLLLLYKNGYDVGKYVSFEEQINNDKIFYYEALKDSSVGWTENSNNYFPFIENFLATLHSCYKELSKRFAIINSKKVTKKSRIETTVLNTFAPISKAEICKILPDVSPTTIEAVLGVMIKSGQIERIGSGRASRYIKKQN